MDQATYADVKTAVKALLNVDLDGYKDQQMRRRLASWLARSGEISWESYFARVRTDTAEQARFRDYLTINVTRFFRDPERWHTLAQHVLPRLLREAPSTAVRRRGLRLWSAGCATGPETYSLAILLDALAPRSQHSILATDLDRGALDVAKAGGPYGPQEVQNLTPGQRVTYLQPGGPPYFVRESLRKRVVFRRQDLVRDAFPSGLDLIVCRNVVIYFTEETKQELYRKFHAALRPGGVLFLGSTEVLPQSQRQGFRDRGVSFYEKV